MRQNNLYITILN